MSAISNLKRVLIGKPIHTKHAHHERLPKVFGLPIFASDALSSVAYASEEIMLVLVAGGAIGLSYLFNVSLWLGVLMIIVAFSYWQTIMAYPKGGGTYLVSTENLGSRAGQIAGASLLIDYVLTVAVSISSGVAAVVSAVPQAQPYAVLIGCTAILLLMLANLRGAKESGLLFAIPTYTFILCVYAVIVGGIIKGLNHGHVVANVPAPQDGTFHAITAFLMLRAFAASCTALTGTEAIADGVQAFRPPESKNAAQTLGWMVFFLLTMFLGISYVAMHEGLVPMHAGQPGYMTVLAQICNSVYGQGWFFYALQAATAAILFLAANTAFADFPRLSSFIAKDGFLPRQLMSIGDRLVFQNGVVLLALSAMALIVIYHADTHSLIPLYAMGVFISFTMSQVGMARKFKRENAPKWKMLVSGFGGLVTFAVLVILLLTKFMEGAWLIIVALVVMLYIFRQIKNHYRYLSNELTVTVDDQVPAMKSTALLLVPRLHRGILQAIGYAQTLAHDVRALHVTIDPSTVNSIKSDWNRFGAEIPLVILESPYRSLVQPVIDYIDEALAEDPNAFITVIVPQAVPKKWYHGILHNNAAVPLKLALASRKNVVITNVRYFLK
jgi:amino acid transporter